ncbi:MAG TPA: glycoside hydrolase family 15 protein [Acidimicrobiia bacterium]|nr:glycoside hydrolase family 15 protein [Acidimicrobiia bacterium]
MTDDAGFAPVRAIDGYLPLEDHGLVGDGTTAALVGRDGAVSWLCVPRFDADPLFCRILDAGRGGAFTIAPEGLVESRQRYEPDTGVLVTELRGETGLVRVTDALTLRSGAALHEDVPAGRSELLRRVEAVEGPAQLRVEIEPYGGADVSPRAEGLELRCRARPDLDLEVDATRKLDGPRSVHRLERGDRMYVVLRWSRGPRRLIHRDPEESLRNTVAAWREWVRCFEYAGPQEELVRRSAITLKLLDHVENGAILAAPTSSLPEAIGGPRNWDYRYAWVRDAAFSVYALRRIGLTDEARRFLAWVLDASSHGGRPRVLYDLDGQPAPPEREDGELEGYRRSRPVRWGNAASDQRQHDVYGEILDCAYQWSASGAEIDQSLWRRLSEMVDAAGREWHEPDRGIWEVRTPGRPFTYSAALCQVALDRGARLSDRHGLPGDPAGWRKRAAEIVETILDAAWDDEQGSLTEHLGGGGLDASLLALSLRRVVPADHPRMVATVDAVADRLSPGDGLLYRYLPGESPDGLPGHEGAFLLCSFWLVDNLASQGRVDEAGELYDSLCARAGPLGLLPEQIDPSTDAYLGNYPQAFSHVGLVSSGYNLSRAGGRERG